MGPDPQRTGRRNGCLARTIYYRANLFDQAGMAALLPAEPPPPGPQQDKRTLPPDMRQEIVDLHAQYPAFRPHEIATICFVKFNRKPASATIQLILAVFPHSLDNRAPLPTLCGDGRWADPEANRHSVAC